MRYAIVIEKAGKNYAAYVPDLPGCVATGKTVEDRATNTRGHRVSYPGYARRRPADSGSI